ncbi:MAG: hypothetical protein ACUVQ8_02125 [Nitrososphaeria archaeon]
MLRSEIELTLVVFVAILLTTMMIVLSARADLSQIMILSFILLSITLLNFLKAFQNDRTEKDN